MEKFYASIDIGTNSTRLLVANKQNGQLEAEKKLKKVTRLGKDLTKTGVLSAQSMENTITAIQEFVTVCSNYKIAAKDIKCVATSASRDAKNGAEFMAVLQNKTGVKADIVSGDTEAFLAFVGVTSYLEKDSALLVIDIGGGSTEFCYGTKQSIEFKRSLNVGAVRLKEMFFSEDVYDAKRILEASQWIESIFSPLAVLRSKITLCVGVAGTITTQITMRDLQDCTQTEALSENLITLKRSDVQNNFDQLKNLTVSQREAVIGVPKDRADVIVCGTLILLKILEYLDILALQVSDRDNLEGMLLTSY